MTEKATQPTCPATYHGMSCIKHLTRMSNGEWIHGGGHMFATPEKVAEMDAPGFDARAFLANARQVPKEEIVNG